MAKIVIIIGVKYSSGEDQFERKVKAKPGRNMQQTNDRIRVDCHPAKVRAVEKAHTVLLKTPFSPFPVHVVCVCVYLEKQTNALPFRVAVFPSKCSTDPFPLRYYTVLAERFALRLSQLPGGTPRDRSLEVSLPPAVTALGRCVAEDTN